MTQRGRSKTQMNMKLGISIVCAGLLLFVAGCQKAAELQTVHGQPISHWLDELKKPDARARKKAVIALESVGAKDSGAIQAIVGALKDADATVRDTAVLALLNIGPDAHEAAPALESMKNDKDPTVRTHAAKAIERIQANSASG
jgi:HEAT repeat protein